MTDDSYLDCDYIVRFRDKKICIVIASDSFKLIRLVFIAIIKYLWSNGFHYTKTDLSTPLQDEIRLTVRYTKPNIFLTLSLRTVISVIIP